MKELINIIKELRKTDKGKAVIFFAVSFVVFLFLGILARTTGTHPVETNVNENYSHDVSIDELLDNNFSYVYTVEVDGKKYTINGKINENVEEFEFSNDTNTVNYYRSGENYYVKNNEVWEKGNVPLELSKFFKTKDLNSIIKKSTLDSKTDYKSGKVNYNLLVSTNTINKILDKQNTDFDDEPNEISVSFDENKKVENIDLKLKNYCISNGICSNDLNMRLEYDDIGKIGVIKNPLTE